MGRGRGEEGKKDVKRGDVSRGEEKGSSNQSTIITLSVMINSQVKRIQVQ